MAVTNAVLPSDQGEVPTLVFTPEGSGRHPAIVLSTEAFGINEFTHHIASSLAGQGYVVIVPDYYRGNGLKDPESYTDFTEVGTFIERLDFAHGTHDIMAGIDYARSRADVAPGRVAVWGYCTGATLAMLAASLDRQLAAAVLFFPSQPTFPELTPKRPVHPIDMLWNVACPVLLVVGDQDGLLFPLIPEFRRRFEQWHIEHEINVYEGAGHAFSAPVPPLRHDGADKASWADALTFAARHLR